MEQLNQYLPLIITIALCVVIVLTAIIAAGLNKLFKNIVSNKFAMADIEEVNIHTGKKTYAVIVSNKSMNDAGITSVGLVSGLKYFDFKETYKAENNVTGDTLIVMPRTPVKLVLCPQEVEKLVFSNLNQGKFLPVKTYVIDSTGNIFLQRAKNLQKILKAHYKAYLARVKAAKAAEEKENKLKGDYAFLQSVKSGEMSAFKDKIKVVLMKKVSEEDISAAEKASEAAKRDAEKYSLENEVAANVSCESEQAETEVSESAEILNEAEESAEEIACTKSEETAEFAAEEEVAGDVEEEDLAEETQSEGENEGEEPEENESEDVSESGETSDESEKTSEEEEKELVLAGGKEE